MSAFEKLTVPQRIAIIVSEGKLRLRNSPAGSKAKANCPFHFEKFPSFHINCKTGQWHCFGCGRGGDFIDFVSEITGISKTAFRDLLKYIDEKYGTSLYADRQKIDADSVLIRIYEYATNWYHETLLRMSHSHPAWRYLERRKVSEASIRKYRIGYGGDRSDHLLSHLAKCSSLSQQDLDRSALSYAPKEERKRSDVFWGRILFPITFSGRVVSFSGRSINTRTPKYINGGKTSIFSKSACLFGLDQAKESIVRQNYAILVEGFFDVVSMVQAGYPNTVGLMGTAASGKQMQLLASAAKRVLLFLDVDDAGSLATTQRVLPAAVTANLSCWVINPVNLELNDKKLDPDSLCGSLEYDALQTVIQDCRQSPEEFVFHQSHSRLKPEESESENFKNRNIFEFASVFRNCPNPCRQQEAASWLAKKIGVDSQLILKFFVDEAAYTSLHELVVQSEIPQRMACA